MTEHTVTFDLAKQPVRVPTGTLLSEAARLAGVSLREMTQQAVAHGLRPTVDEETIAEELKARPS